MFLNPIMLFGLTAISVPIIIHLLNRRRFERVVWAAMRFLRVSVEQNQRRIQIEDIILLIVRCLLLTLLVLALARPVIRAAGSLLGQAKVTAVVVLDNSASMSQKDGVHTRFQLAKDAAEQILRNLPAGSSAAVLLASDIAHELIPEPTFDLTLAANTVRQAALFDRPTDLYESIRRAVDLLRGRPTIGREIYVITDGQASGWKQMDAIRALLEQNRREITAHVVLVGNSLERNLGISSLRIDSGLCAVNQPIRVEARVRNYGRSQANPVTVSVAVDDEPPMDQATVGPLPPGEERSAVMFVRVRNEGYHTVTARIDSDHMPADDWRSAAFRAIKDVAVLLIDGDPGREPRESAVFFLKLALRPVPRAEWDDYYIKLVTRTPAELEGLHFEDYAAVVAANVTDFSPAAVEQLAAYVRAGGTMLVFPGEKVNRTFYNEQLHDRLGLLPARLGETRGDARSQEKWFSLSDRFFEHDIVSLWKDPAAGTLSSARFFKIFELLVPGEKAGGKAPGSAATRVVARFADNTPAIVEKDVGMGRTILFASTANTEWTDLPARAGIFVPLMHRTLGRLVARQDEHLTIRVGRDFVHTPSIKFINRDVMITKRARPWSEAPPGTNELEESRRIELVDGTPLLAFKATNLAGPYEARTGDTLLVRFAVQSDPDESVLDELTAEQMDALSGTATVLRWTTAAAFADSLRQSRIGTELWLPVAAIALVLAVMETVLAHWFSRPK